MSAPVSLSHISSYIFSPLTSGSWESQRLSGGLLTATELAIFLSFLFPPWSTACHFPNNCFLSSLRKVAFMFLWGAEVQSTLLVIPPLWPGGETSLALPFCGHPLLITKLFRKGVSSPSLKAWEVLQWCFPNHSEMTNWKLSPVFLSLLRNPIMGHKPDWMQLRPRTETFCIPTLGKILSWGPRWGFGSIFLNLEFERMRKQAIGEKTLPGNQKRLSLFAKRFFVFVIIY